MLLQLHSLPEGEVQRGLLEHLLHSGVDCDLTLSSLWGIINHFEEKKNILKKKRTSTAQMRRKMVP